MIDVPDDGITMKRYTVESVAFAPDLNSILVRFQEPGNVGGPVLGQIIEQEITLRDDNDLRLRERVYEIVDFVCDIIDEVHAERRRAAR